MEPLRTRLAEIDTDFTRCCMRFQESFHPHLLNVIAGRRWLLTHGMKLLMVKCLNSNEYMEALGHAFGRANTRKVRTVKEATGNLSQEGRSQTPMKMISISLGHVRKEILSHLGSDTLVSRGLGCPAMSKHTTEAEIRKIT
ncbi:hypothetical protein Tco_1272001 [Tanacetum coccineum]